jgi:hypothetical protein
MGCRLQEVRLLLHQWTNEVVHVPSLNLHLAGAIVFEIEPTFISTYLLERGCMLGPPETVKGQFVITP